MLADWYPPQNQKEEEIMSQLQGAQIEKIYHAFISGYSDKGDLERMVQFNLNKNLDVIAGGDNLGEIVLDLIQWAMASGRLRELVFAAHEHSPGNLDLKAVADSFDQWQQKPVASDSNSDTPPTTFDTKNRFMTWRQKQVEFLRNATSF